MDREYYLPGPFRLHMGINSMTLITIIRIVLFATFFLLIAGEIAVVIVYVRFYKLYISKHIELQRRVAVLEAKLDGRTDNVNGDR
jgi:hypothetical protein